MKSYPVELIQAAKEKGYKAANLDFLDKILLEFEGAAPTNIHIEVPKHISISNQVITTHLNQYSPKWKDQWDEFCELQGSDENLKPAALAKLKEIQTSIHQAFAYTLSIGGLDQAESWMVRSTGEEDRVDVANPGGNESVPSDTASINQSIAQVVASYFSEKSMSQRLKSGENITAKPPLTACLIQKLIGEKQGVGLPPVSGVIYTDQASNVRIQAAYGHGELIVNSKGNFDNIFVTNESVVHQYLGDKKIRLVPIFDFENKKITLEEVSNTEFARVPSLDEEVSMDLAKFANFVEAKYGMRMDLEFVFDSNSKTINIVQARPIPEGKRKGLVPSALNDDFITTHKPPHSDGKIITPDVMTAKAITSKDEILICDSIDEALTRFLKDKDNKFKAVVINKTAPDTSHEAGFFASQAIPVIHADQYDLVKSWVDNFDGNVLVIDPQRASIYQIKQAQFQDELIEEGVFRSTLAPFVMPIARDFAEGPRNEFPQIKAKSIGELVIEARSNPDATNRLFRFIHDEIGVHDTKEYDDKTIDQDIKQLLSYPSTQEDFQSHAETLAHLLNFVVSVKNEKAIAPSTYQQLMITGMELHKALKEIESQPQNPQTKIHYLDIHQKFKGLMLSEGAKDILSTSIRQEINAHNERELLKQQVIDAGFDLSLVPEKTFLNLARHKVYLINDGDQQKWLSFCYEACKSPENAQDLQNLVSDITKLNLQDYWLNINFLAAYNKDKDSSLPNLKAEYEKNLDASGNILKAAKLIDKMEHQISQWSRPEKFAKLFEAGFKQDLEEINKLIMLDDENKLASHLAAKQLYRLVDAIDLSIKQLQNSHLYENKEQQVKNFRAMLGEFLNLMDQRISINKDRIHEMQKFLRSKDNSNSGDEVLPSRDFSVIKADFFQDVGFNTGFREVQNKNLADLYTLIHQSLLSSIGRDSAGNNEELIRVLPEDVQEMHANISNDNSDTFNNSYNKGYKKNISLMYIEAIYPQVNLYYKIPLNVHSGTLKLEYDIENKNIKLDINFFGLDHVGKRWLSLRESAFLLLETFTDVKLIEHKADDNILNLQIEISQDTKKLKELFEIINTISAATFNLLDFLSDFYNDDAIDKSLRASGLSKFSIDVYRDNEGNLDFKNLKEVINKLKGSNKQQIQDNLEKEGLIRIIAMGEGGRVDDRILKRTREEITSIPGYADLDLVGLVNENIPKLSFPNYVILANELLIKGNIKNTLKIMNIINIDDPSCRVVDSYTSSYLANVVAELIIQGHMTEKIAKKFTEQSHLSEVANKLIEKGHANEVVKLTERITGQSRLMKIAEKLIKKNYINEAVKLTERITEPYYLGSIHEELIEKNYINEAVKLTERITEPNYLGPIAEKLIEKGHANEAVKLTERITGQSALIEIAKKLIEKGHTNEAVKLTERITGQSRLMKIAEKLIEKGHTNEAVKLTERITEPYPLCRIAEKLIEKGHANEAVKLTERITEQSRLIEIAEKLIEKNYINEAVKLTKKIKNYHVLPSIAEELIEKGQTDKALELAGKITNGSYLVSIVRKLIDKGHLEQAIQLAKQMVEKINDPKILNIILADFDQSSKVEKEIADMITYKIPTIWKQFMGYIGQAHEFLVAHDPLKFLGVAAAEIPPPPPAVSKAATQRSNMLGEAADYVPPIPGIAPPPIDVQLPDLSSQFALAAVMGKISGNAYKGVVDYLNRDPAPLVVPKELTKINDKLYQRLIKMNKIDGLSKELDKTLRTLPHSFEVKIMAQKLVELGVKANELTQSYYGLNNPTAMQMEAIYKDVKKLDKSLMELVKDATTRFPQLLVRNPTAIGVSEPTLVGNKAESAMVATIRQQPLVAGRHAKMIGAQKSEVTPKTKPYK